MNAYKVELLVIDFEGHGPDEIKNTIEHNRYFSVNTMDIIERDIGEWEDDHPLNSGTTQKAEYERIFSEEK